MKRRVRLGIGVVALALHVLAPFAAYASVKAIPGYDDLCSVIARTVPAGTAPVGLPAQQSDRHSPAHCAFCPGGSAAVAVPPGVLVIPFLVPTGTFQTPVAVGAAIAAAPILFPPPRGPPASPNPV